MLELRPTCEHCNEPLPPASREARITSQVARVLARLDERREFRE
jgi:hypothetical protein